MTDSRKEATISPPPQKLQQTTDPVPNATSRSPLLLLLSFFPVSRCARGVFPRFWLWPTVYQHPDGDTHHPPRGVQPAILRILASVNRMKPNWLLFLPACCAQLCGRCIEVYTISSSVYCFTLVRTVPKHGLLGHPARLHVDKINKPRRVGLPPPKIAVLPGTAFTCMYAQPQMKSR